MIKKTVQENGTEVEKMVQKQDILEWTPLASAKIQNKPVDNVKVGALPEYVLLWPIPQDEMQRNPALEGHQHPGWN